MSSDVAIRVENLSKVYRIGAREARYKTLRESVMDVVGAPLKRLRRRAPTEEETLWALKDVSFEIKRGEVVGIIGRNGAGKSTLLKILSRITEPTSGRAEIHGRVGSLLEVGTGFHPELTGRENIYLNGAILGMRRAEIDRKLDEIVAFAGVERFLETAVKHYSSGMYLRLAFSVAAHLEAEALLVDEVLAVGDAQFQARCLGKMSEISNEGRTVILVTHQLGAIRQLTHRTLLLNEGTLAQDGDSERVVQEYLTAAQGKLGSGCSWTAEDAPGDNDVRLLAFGLSEAADGQHRTSSELQIRILLDCKCVPAGLCVGFDLQTPDGTTILRSFHTDGESGPVQLPCGQTEFVCTLPAGLLNGGEHLLAPRIGVHNKYWIVSGDPLVRFHCQLDHGRSPYWHQFSSQARPGAVSPVLAWYQRAS